MAPIPSNIPSADQVAVSPVKPVGPTVSIPVTINCVLLEIVALAQEAVREKFGPFPYGAEVAVNEVTHIGTPVVPTAPYSIILYVPKGKDQQTFYEASVAVDKPGAPPRLTSPPVELPGTYLLKKRESSPKHVTHDVTSGSYPKSLEERRAYEFALQQLKKKFPLHGMGLLKAEQLADPNLLETEWRFTIAVDPLVSGPKIHYETWQVVVKESILSPLRLWLVSITQLDGQAVAKPPTQLEDGGYEDVPVTLPLHVGLDRAVIFAVKAFKQAKDPKSVLVKIDRAETQVVNGTNWRLTLTFSDLVPLKEDQTFVIQPFEANDGIFKLTSILGPLPEIIGTDFLTAEYYLSFFATAAAKLVASAVSKLKKRPLCVKSILAATEVLPSGVTGDYSPTWVLKLILQDEKTGEDFLGIGTVATDFTQAPLPLRFVSWEDLPAPGSQSGAVMSGGYKPVKVDLPAVLAAAGFATSTLSTILTGLPGRATLSSVDSADEQVVDGVNWRLTLEVELAQHWPAGGGLGPVILPTKFEVLVNQTPKKEYKLVSWNIVNAEPGGYRPVPVGLPAVQDAAKFAAGALPKLLPGNHRPAELLRVESAEEQVVDGRNWRLKIVVTFPPADPLSYKYEVLVFQGDGCEGYTLKSANQIPE